MRKILLVSSFIVFGFYSLSAQVAVSTETPFVPDASAALQLHMEDPVTNGYKGFLIPRLSTIEGISISNAGLGLLYYDTTDEVFKYHDGSAWVWIGQTTQATAIATTNNGDLFFDTDEGSDNKLKYYNGSGWQSFTINGGGAITP